MSCPSFQNLSRFADATLSEQEASVIVAHLNLCEICSQKVDELEHQPKQPMIAAFRELQCESIPVTDSPLPQKIAQYEILEKIGQGGMGTVYRAVHPHLKREVALKVIRDTRLDDPTARARFVQEMHSLGKLTHPNIVHATDAGCDADTLFIVTELLDGQDLNSYVQQHGKMPLQLAVDCIRQAALGLQHAHQAGYVHRDIKPSNLFLLRNGNLKILDLGIAKPVELKSGQTLTGHVIGSPEFMAPEQFRGGTVDARSDIYSLGRTFLYMLTGKHGDDSVTDIPPRLGTILARMTAGASSQRFQNADELIKSLNALTRTKRRLLVSLLVGVTIFIGVLAVAGQAWKENETQIDTATPAVKTIAFSPQFTDEEQAEVDGYLASFVEGRSVDVHGRYEGGWTLLHSAVSVSPSIAVTKYLVSLGADVNAKDDFGRTPLHLAVSGGSTEIPRFLVSQGADVNARNNVNNTPLHSALDNSNIAITKFLVSQGADVRARNSFGKTPLDLARERGKTVAVEYLSEL